jgi:hypothetical protein
MKISILQLAHIIDNLDVNQEINFSQEINSDYWGVRRIAVFEGEVILLGYYGGNYTNLFNIFDLPEKKDLIEFLCRNLDCSDDDSVYYKVSVDKDVFTLNAELEQSISVGTDIPSVLIPAFMHVIRNSPKAVDSGWLWPGETRNNPNHFWFESRDCKCFMKELTNTLKNYAPYGYYFGVTEIDDTNFGYWKRKL